MATALLLLLLLLSTAAPVHSTLLGTFCNNNLGLVDIPSNGHGIPSATFHATSICLSFLEESLFQLTIEAIVNNKPSIYATRSTCDGQYFFGAENTIVLGYENFAPSICTQNNSLPALCPWVCAQFGGTYQAFFSQPLSAPRYLTVNPASVSPSYNWGTMDVTFPMTCLNDSCGSAADIFPPVPVPENIVR